jgi:hypothetical protein
MISDVISESAEVAVAYAMQVCSDDKYREPLQAEYYLKLLPRKQDSQNIVLPQSYEWYDVNLIF